jgi:subtilase family serine protease
MKCLLLLALCASSHAALHHASLPSGWVQKQVFELDSAELRAPVSFVLSLKEDAGVVTAIKKTALAVSDPDSPSYGQFLNAAQIDAMTAPKAEDLKIVTSWLETAGVTSYAVKGSRVEVVASTEQTEKLFDTKFVVLVNEKFGQAVRRAADYYVPQHIEERVQAVFGLHGLPLPKNGPIPTVTTSENPPAQPALVTPAVLEQVYSISGVTPKAASNKQAVAEFQGQYMSDKDLADFFKKYVTKYTVGKDDKVSKYVGDQDKQIGQTEASLDIQYIMGVNPGLKSEFWLYNSMDFCGDLANWTAAILADDAAPFVHSVSYGWQGDLSQLHCTADKIKVVDDNFAKLAAKGISIIFASGDSGSGYSPNHNQCMGSGKQEELSGKVLRSMEAREAIMCCEEADQAKASGWSFAKNSGPAPPPPPATCPHLGNDMYWNGNATTTTTVADADACCAAAQKAATPEHHPRFTFTPGKSANSGKCEIFSTTVSIKHGSGKTSGFVEPPQPASGNCTLYSSVTGSKPNPAVTSGQKGPAPKVQLWPSWPASSGWITAVGSTRFVGQKVGAEQMATDQFGSGGGFSKMFTIAKDATYQADAVKTYLAQPAGPGFKLPPAGSYPPGGRATPDLSALGEGYQVLQNGHVSSVGGTSASTPAFSGMVALLNDARIAAGKKQMGFLNPWVYKNTAAFTDITKGNNAIGRGTFNLPYGFNATKGWDPVTGVGTPIFTKMLAAAMKN